MYKNLAVLFASCALVAACGGGGSSSGSSGSTPPSSPSPAPTPPGNASTFLYESQTYTNSSTEFTTQAEAQGQRSFRYVTAKAVMSGGGSTLFNLYVKDSGTFTYKLVPTATTKATLQTQLNTQGAAGYRWTGDLGWMQSGTFASFAVYRKLVGTSTTYTYTVLNAVSDSAGTITQANQQGAVGALMVGADTLLVGPDTVRIYETASGSSARYSYEAQSALGTESNALSLLNSQGSRGYRFRNESVFTDGTKSLFVKDTTQSSNFVYKFATPATTISGVITAANTEGALGYAYTSDYSFSGTQKTVYVKPSSCAGILCGVTSGLSF